MARRWRTLRAERDAFRAMKKVYMSDALLRSRTLVAAFTGLVVVVAILGGMFLLKNSYLNHSAISTAALAATVTGSVISNFVYVRPRLKKKKSRRH
jgi:hypothetical protein